MQAEMVAGGAISDKIERKPLLMFFGIAGTLSAVPILNTLFIRSSRRSSPSC